MKLTVDEIAACFGVSSSTIRRWIRQGRIPIHNEGDSCFFTESMLKKWAQGHNLTYSLTDKDKVCGSDVTTECLLAAMQRGGVVYDITGKTVEAVLKNAVDAMSFRSPDLNEKIVKRLIDRENLMSTGIGKGVAFPHPRTPLSDDLAHPIITTCFLKEPIDYKAVDDAPVFLLFILLSPSTTTHLQLLSRLAFCMRDNRFICFLQNIPSADMLFEKISKFEKQLENAGSC